MCLVQGPHCRPVRYARLVLGRGGSKRPELDHDDAPLAGNRGGGLGWLGFAPERGESQIRAHHAPGVPPGPFGECASATGHRLLRRCPDPPSQLLLLATMSTPSVRVVPFPRFLGTIRALRLLPPFP